MLEGELRTRRERRNQPRHVPHPLADVRRDSFAAQLELLGVSVGRLRIGQVSGAPVDRELGTVQELWWGGGVGARRARLHHIPELLPAAEYLRPRSEYLGRPRPKSPARRTAGGDRASLSGRDAPRFVAAMGGELGASTAVAWLPRLHCSAGRAGGGGRGVKGVEGEGGRGGVGGGRV